MAIELAISGELYDALIGHLLPDTETAGEDRVEQVAFLFAAADDGDVLRATGIRMLGPGDFDVQSDFHVSVADHVRPELIKGAGDTDACLIEAHSHLDDRPVRFSASDLYGFEEWVPHVRWRLRGRPYIALVFGSESFDALCWTDASGEPEPLGRLVIDGRGPLLPTNRSYARSRSASMSADERYERQIRFFGVEGQARIADSRVAIVGLGGLGSHVAQQVAYLGVVQFVLIDNDVVTATSLNRLIGALPADVDEATPKVTVAERMISTIQPSATIRPVLAAFDRERADEQLADIDSVFGCLDDDPPRFDLTATCAERALLYIDAATDIADDASYYGGRVVVADGHGCLVCRDEIDQHALARRQMTPEQRAADDKTYGVNHAALGGTGPSVVSLNGVVASLAVTEGMVATTGLRAPFGQLTYRADLGKVTVSRDAGGVDCYFCKRFQAQAARSAPGHS